MTGEPTWEECANHMEFLESRAMGDAPRWRRPSKDDDEANCLTVDRRRHYARIAKDNAAIYAKLAALARQQGDKT